MRAFLSVFLMLVSGVSQSNPEICTYQTYDWNIYTQQAENFETIQKPYTALSDNEIDKQTGCTVCQEDQVQISIENIPPFKICRKLAGDIQAALEESISLGQSVIEVVGYRVGKTKGNVDQQGNRLQFSYHSYGTAIDINPDFNGLYENCMTYGPQCRLIKGGGWHPDHPESLQANAPIVQIMRSIGFYWGGEMAGMQKDFMHFSLTGY